MLILTLGEVEQALSIKDCINAVEIAFRQYAQGHAGIPPNRIFHRFAPDLAWIYAIAGAIFDDNVMVLKGLSVNWENPEKYGLPHMFGIILLCDARTGLPYALMDATYITNARTGAVAGLGAKYLARRECEKVAVIGSGAIARYSLMAVKEVIPSVNHVRVFSRTAKHRLMFAEEMRSRINAEIEPVGDASHALKDADIVITATSARAPVVLDPQIKSGTFIAGMGSKHEIDPIILSRAKLVTEFAQECKTHGKFGLALENGLVMETDLYAQLEDLVSGKKPGRISDSEITLLDSIGLAIEDAAVAKVAYVNARKIGLGVEVDMFKGLRLW